MHSFLTTPPTTTTPTTTTVSSNMQMNYVGGAYAVAPTATLPMPMHMYSLGGTYSTTAAPGHPLCSTGYGGLAAPGVWSSGSKPIWSTSQGLVPPTHPANATSINLGVPAGLGVAKPIWYASQVTPGQPTIVPPMNPGQVVNDQGAGGGWPGWGQMQGTPGQVGVPLVPPTLLPQALLHQDWFSEGKSSDSKCKRSKHWMRPDFYIPVDKKYNELSFRELMFGMVSVAECMARYNLPNYPVLNYLEHMK